jgi:hypothetical protein
MSWAHPCRPFPESSMSSGISPSTGALVSVEAHILAVIHPIRSRWLPEEPRANSLTATDIQFMRAKSGMVGQSVALAHASSNVISSRWSQARCTASQARSREDKGNPQAV